MRPVAVEFASQNSETNPYKKTPTHLPKNGAEMGSGAKANASLRAFVCERAYERSVKR